MEAIDISPLRGEELKKQYGRRVEEGIGRRVEEVAEFEEGLGLLDSGLTQSSAL
jgi:hypothetical protein